MALLSLMARLGSSDPVELRADMAELIEGFDITRFGAAPTKFDVEDLYPLTARYLQSLPLDAVQSHVDALGVPAAKQAAFWDVAKENITTLKDLAQWWELCRDGAEPLIADEDKDFIAEAMALLPEGPYDADSWKNWTNAVKEATGRKGKGLFMPLRKAVTGMERGPDMSALLALMEKVRARG
jgi:glutamyl-tRNA synthetase